MAGWRIGFMVGNKTLVSALARIKKPSRLRHPLRRCRWRRLRHSRAINSACATLPNSTNDAVMYWSGLHDAGWMVEMPKASMYVWAKIRNLTLPWAR
ncbi:aminotransferase class I/II-fold pyridoxal phosphate-dependent enzyme [Shigella boydii]